VRFISTRGGQETDLTGAVMQGLAADGGLFVPDALPRIDPARIEGESLAEIAAEMLAPFFADSMLESELGIICREALDFPVPLRELKGAPAPLAVLESGEYLEAFEVLRRSGKVRYCGVACETSTQSASARQCFDTPGIAAVQIQAHLLDTTHREIAAEGTRRDVAVIARNPRDQGFLTSAYGDLTAETYAASARVVAERAAREHPGHVLIRPDRTHAQAALQFLLRDPGIAVVLPRIWNEAGLREALGTLHAPDLSAAERAEIEVVRKGL